MTREAHDFGQRDIVRASLSLVRERAQRHDTYAKRARRDAPAAPSAAAVLKQMRDSVDEVNEWFESIDGVAELERAYPCRPAVEPSERAA